MPYQIKLTYNVFLKNKKHHRNHSAMLYIQQSKHNHILYVMPSYLCIFHPIIIPSKCSSPNSHFYYYFTLFYIRFLPLNDFCLCTFFRNRRSLYYFTYNMLNLILLFFCLFPWFFAFFCTFFYALYYSKQRFCMHINSC